MSAVVHWKLSPNEEAERIRSEKERRRKVRLLQVRQQERVFAKKLRDDIKNRRDEENQLLLKHLNAQYEAFCEEELDRLQEKCEKQLKMIGTGHVCAKNQTLDDEASSRVKKQLAYQQRLDSEQRYREAMEELSTNQALEAEYHNRPLVIRKKALEAEKSRAKRIAGLPAPQSCDLVMDLHSKKGGRVTLQGVDGYASSYYHIPSYDVVQQASHDLHQLDAHQSAVEETYRRNTLQQVNTRQTSEQTEKARLRYKHALAKVKLEKDQEILVKELDQLMRQDREQRRQQLSTMPPNLFQPIHRRREITEEQQRDMEQAFEDLFVQCQGSGRGLDGLGRRAPSQGSSANDTDHVDSVYSSSQCPELSVEEMTNTSTIMDTPSSTIHHPTPTTTTTTSVQSISVDITSNTSTTATTDPAPNTSTSSLKRLMEMVQLQRQTWEQQHHSDVPELSSYHHSNEDTSCDPSNSSCDPPSLSVGTASNSWVTNSSASRITTGADDSSLQLSSARPAATPVHAPTIDNSTMSSRTHHDNPDDHRTSPSHHVHISSPTHFASSNSECSSTSGSKCATPTNDITQQATHADRLSTTTTDDVTSLSSNDELDRSEQPFSWQNLSDVEDEESVVPAMTEPKELEISPTQFSTKVSTDPPSLQNAFKQHKAGFISTSQSRLKQLKEKSKERMSSTAKHRQHHKTSYATPQPSSRVVQFSSPLIALQDTNLFTPPTIHRPIVDRFAKLLSSHEKISAKQMKDRTKRLYNMLPEVQQKREAELQEQRSVTNRERARQFHQKLQTHRKKHKK